MSGQGAFRVEGRIVNVRGPGLAEVELRNGHRLLGHLRVRDRAVTELGVGMVVTVELSPFDLSKGRMKLKTDFNHESSSIS